MRTLLLIVALVLCWHLGNQQREIQRLKKQNEDLSWHVQEIGVFVQSKLGNQTENK